MKSIILLLIGFLSTHCLAMDTLRVKTSSEFIIALQPNTVVILEEDNYQLWEAPELNVVDLNKEQHDLPITDFVQYNAGWGVSVVGVNNLHIIGNGPSGKSRIESSNIEDFILGFYQCSNILLKDIEAEHFPAAKGSCLGGVWMFGECENMNVINNVMMGSGTRGISCWKSNEVNVLNSQIRECSQGIVEFNESTSIRFEGCLFEENNSDYGFWTMYACSKVDIKDCEFNNNIAEESRVKKYNKLFNFGSSNKEVRLENLIVKGNNCTYLGTEQFIDNIKENSKLKRNKFESDYPIK